MPTQALLPLLLLCVLLLQAQGGLYKWKIHKGDNKACMKQLSVHHCNDHCSYFLHCSNANTVCCPTFCGNVCMSLR
nr:PREDICTED: protein WFDC10B-like [Equus przewalskii]